MLLQKITQGRCQHCQYPACHKGPEKSEQSRNEQDKQHGADKKNQDLPNDVQTNLPSFHEYTFQSFTFYPFCISIAISPGHINPHRPIFISVLLFFLPVQDLLPLPGPGSADDSFYYNNTRNPIKYLPRTQ